MNYSQYDDIADKYDELFLDEDSLSENTEVGEMLLPLVGSVLDIGCGTGLLTEIVNVSPKDYMGIDPSKKMLDVFKRKHPAFNYVVCSCYDGRVVDCGRFDNVVSLFGSASYLSNGALRELSRYYGHLFLMFYKEGYHPVTYEKCKVDFQHNARSRKYLESLFGKEKVKEFNNYIIVDSR